MYAFIILRQLWIIGKFPILDTTFSFQSLSNNLEVCSNDLKVEITQPPCENIFKNHSFKSEFQNMVFSFFPTKMELSSMQWEVKWPKLPNHFFRHGKYYKLIAILDGKLHVFFKGVYFLLSRLPSFRNGLGKSKTLALEGCVPPLIFTHGGIIVLAT